MATCPFDKDNRLHRYGNNVFPGFIAHIALTDIFNNTIAPIIALRVLTVSFVSYTKIKAATIKLLKIMGIKNILIVLLASVHLAACGQEKKTEDNINKQLTVNKVLENRMKVEVWSDVVCPFCYIGKRKFEKALTQFADSANVDIVWKSYQLQPDMADNYNKSVYELVSEKHGVPLEQVKTNHIQLALAAKEVGLEYNFDKAKPSNTLKAHQVIQFAKTKGKQGEAEEALFHAYFTEGKNLNDIQTLLNIGASIGLDKEALKDALDKGTFIINVQADINEAQQVGVQGVPFFVFNRKYAVSGAQDPKAFLETLQKSFAEWRKDNPTGN